MTGSELTTKQLDGKIAVDAKNTNEGEYDKLIKSKECEMKFDHKDRLIINSKKAHSGRDERKKKG
jgi:hypothetical protein